MSDPAVLAAKERVELIGDPGLADSKTPRNAQAELVLKDGQTLSPFTPQPLHPPTPWQLAEPNDIRRCKYKGSGPAGTGARHGSDGGSHSGGKRSWLDVLRTLGRLALLDAPKEWVSWRISLSYS